MKDLSLREICEKIEFPKDATDYFVELEKRIYGNGEFKKELIAEENRYVNDKNIRLDESIGVVETLAKKYNESRRAMIMLFILHVSRATRKEYEEKGLSDELFFEGLKDSKYKLMECLECKGEYGTFVGVWQDGFLRVDRFALGRFQYEPNRTYNGDDYTFRNGYVIKKGDKYVDFHIPSSGEPLTDEVRNNSYKQAFEFFKKDAKDGILILHVHSWLLFKKHRDFLPKNLNILRFMDDFEIYNSVETERFEDIWRIFGKDENKNVEDLPENTSLQRAYKKWLLDGNKAGFGEGFIILKNGINITNM